jgi:hypothetical protein
MNLGKVLYCLLALALLLSGFTTPEPGLRQGPGKILILEKRADSLFLKIGELHGDIPGNIQFTQYFIDNSQPNTADSYILRDSYFIDKHRIIVAGRCVVDIDKLIKNKTFLRCTGTEYPNHSFGKIPPDDSLVILDSSNIENDAGDPYILTFYDRDIRELLATVGIKKESYTLKKTRASANLPRHLVFTEYNPSKNKSAPYYKLRLIDLKQRSIQDIDSINLHKNEAGILRYFFNASLHWENTSCFTYMTGTVVKDLYDEVFVWEYRTGYANPELVSSFKIDNETMRINKTWTDSYKHRLYGDDILIIEDHRVVLRKAAKSHELYVHASPNKKLIIDALLLQ